MPRCQTCDRAFGTAESLQQHREAKRHCYCRPCALTFAYPQDLDKHKLEHHSWVCAKCDKKFSTQEELARHKKLGDHYFCSDCHRCFAGARALHCHIRATKHATEFRCCDCDRHFVNEKSLNQHLANKIHVIKRDESSNLECSDCNRKFKSLKGLNAHKKSPIHRPISNIKCPGNENDRNCAASFTSPSALLQHLESGSCLSGMNREKLDDIVLAHDTDRIITQSDKDNLLKYGIEDLTRDNENWSSDSDESVVLTPVEDSDSDSDLEMSLVSLTTRCPYCPPDNPPFLNAKSLQMHIDSPVHSPKIYRCPISLAPASSSKKFVMRSFSTLSGLAAHLESGACAGGMATLEGAVGYIEARLEEMGMRGVKLLL
ncbi:hypothetical protein FQN54_008927 [Arachnomyces sp. PD_36]|nr:hypothetical protein FQN54_008927 [Arachnomyces sp. PD_36]